MTRKDFILIAQAIRTAADRDSAHTLPGVTAAALAKAGAV